MVNPSNEPDKPEVPLKDKLAETFNNIKKKENIDDFYSYATANKPDMLAYVVMILGIILLFFNTLWGGILVGAVAGVYFTREILSWLENINEFIEKEGLVRSVIMAGLLLALFICTPAIFISAAIAILIMKFTVYRK